MSVVAIDGPTRGSLAEKPRQTGESTCSCGLAMARRSRQAPQLAATWIVHTITERLASRVKGLTGYFCVLLLTIPAAAGAGTGVCVGGCGKKSLVQLHEILRD